MIEQQQILAIFALNLSIMTLQQLKYIIAIDRYRNFAKAAAELDVTQPTLSALLLKLENELGVRLFERSNKSVRPTATGETVIRQAEKILSQTELISETISEQKGEVSGSLSIGIGASIAPYLMPWFIKKYTDRYLNVRLTVNEMRGDMAIDSLRLGKIDIGIAISGNTSQETIEIPFYCEPFHVYVAKDCLLRMPKFNPADLLHEKMWIMKESQCMRESAFSFCKTRSIGRHIYEAGSIETLIRIVDINGGFTIIPEMHLPFLTDAQRENVRPIEGEYVSQRCVSIYIRKDFIRYRMLKSLIEIMLSIIPNKMIDSNLHNKIALISKNCHTLY